jgi:glutamine amidotransferase
MIAVVSAGIGNIASVRNMIAKAGGGEAAVVTRPEGLREARKILLPGVGSYDAGMEALGRDGLADAIREAASRGAQILGICLGMQLLFGSSEEGRLPGLGLIGGKVERFRFPDAGYKIPHIGWNVVRPVRESPLFAPGGDELRFYHVHSYHAVCDDPGDVAAVTNYGYDFACAVQRGNVMGVQFHPEKSHRFGIDLMRRFIGAPC